MRGFSDEGAYAIGRLLLLIVREGALGACQITFKKKLND